MYSETRHRSRNQHTVRQSSLNYEILEDVKKGIFLSTKYECKMKTFKPPMMVIFMNHFPDISKLSEDRFDICFKTDDPLYAEFDGLNWNY